MSLRTKMRTMIISSHNPSPPSHSLSLFLTPLSRSPSLSLRRRCRKEKLEGETAEGCCKCFRCRRCPLPLHALFLTPSFLFYILHFPVVFTNYYCVFFSLFQTFLFLVVPNGAVSVIFREKLWKQHINLKRG